MIEFSKIVGCTVGLSSTLMLLGYLNISKPLRFWSRLLVYVIIIAICAILGTVEGVLFNLVGKRGLVQWITARTFYTLCRLFLGYRVEINDPHNHLGSTRPAVFISNHQSELDIMLLGATFPKWCSVTAKKVLKWYPFLGWFMCASKTIFVDRSRRKNPMKTFEKASREVLRDQQSVFMFPEGTRSYSTSPTLLPFKKGAFHFAQQAQIPVIPYVISNYSNLWNWESMTSEPGIIRVDVLDPISTKGLESKDVGNLTEQTYKKMFAVVQKLGFSQKI